MRDAENWGRDMRICTHWRDEYGRFHGAVVPPVYENALFVFPDFDAYVRARAEEKEHYVYWRGTNPTVEIAERKLAALEGGVSCKCFASGMAAIAAALLGELKSGDHAACVGPIYEETKKLLQYLQKFGVAYSIAPSPALADIERTLRPETKVIFLESPSSYTFRVADLAAVAGLAKARGIRTIADNTWATPLYQKPLALGIDLVVHSASKYLGGHSDLVAGAVIGREEDLRRLFYAEYLLFGAAMAPFEAALLLRGLRTLPLRMERHRETALRVAEFLETHPAVERVNYPALPSHPDYELANRQMSGCSGLLSFELKNAAFAEVRRVMNRFKLFGIGVSWGSFESLALSPNEGHNAEQLKAEGVNPGLIRLSVGMEEPEALIEDLRHALGSL